MIGAVAVVLRCGALQRRLWTRETAGIREAATVLNEIHAVPDKDVPQELWEQAHCVMVVPSLKKAAFVMGRTWQGSHELPEDGHVERPGVHGDREWELGPSNRRRVDRLVLLVMNDRGMDTPKQTG